MKLQKIGKVFLLVGLVSILVGGVLPTDASAVTTEEHQAMTVEPRYSGILRIESTLEIVGGNAECVGVVTVKSGYTSEITLALQQCSSGGKWSDIISWDGGGDGSLVRHYSVRSGYDYRVRVTAKVYDNAGKYVATYDKNSNVVPY